MIFAIPTSFYLCPITPRHYFFRALKNHKKNLPKCLEKLFIKKTFKCHNSQNLGKKQASSRGKKYSWHRYPPKSKKKMGFWTSLILEPVLCWDGWDIFVLKTPFCPPVLHSLHARSIHTVVRYEYGMGLLPGLGTVVKRPWNAGQQHPQRHTGNVPSAHREEASRGWHVSCSPAHPTPVITTLTEFANQTDPCHLLPRLPF